MAQTKASAPKKPKAENRLGQVTGEAASKAKIPLIAGGAALVGAASGIALNAARPTAARSWA